MTQQQQERLLALLREHKVSLERFVLNMTRNRADAKELLSETIALVCESFEKLRDEQAFLSYVFSIALRRWRAHRAHAARVEVMSVEEIDQQYSGGLNPEESQAFVELRAAIDTLDPEYREVLVLAELVGLPHKEIAEVLKISPANVRVRVHRAKQMLRTRLTDSESVQKFLPESHTAKP